LPRRVVCAVFKGLGKKPGSQHAEFYGFIVRIHIPALLIIHRSPLEVDTCCLVAERLFVKDSVGEQSSERACNWEAVLHYSPLFRCAEN